MHKKPLVSIIMPCYKMGFFIDEALKSVGQQTYRFWEVIAVDDCAPDDGTAEIVRSFANKFPSHRVEWFRHETNRGVGAARNTAIKESRGELVAFLDPDDCWMPDYLERNVDVFKSSSNVDIAVSPVKRFIEGKEPYHLSGPNLIELSCFPASLSGRNYVQPSSTVVRADALRSVGGFDEGANIQHVEDWDLWIRMSISGCSFRFLKDARCFYRKHSDSATNDVSAMNDRYDALMLKHRLWFDRMRSQFLSQLSNRQSKIEVALSYPLTRRVITFDYYISRICHLILCLFKAIRIRITRNGGDDTSSHS